MEVKDKCNAFLTHVRTWAQVMDDGTSHGQGSGYYGTFPGGERYKQGGNRRAKDGNPTRKSIVNAGSMTNISPRTPMYISRKISTDSRFAITTTPVNASYLALRPELMRARGAGSLDTFFTACPGKGKKGKRRED